MLSLRTSKRQKSRGLPNLPRLLNAFALCALALGAAHTAALGQSGPGVRTDRAVYAAPAPPAMPQAGSKAVDPTFGTEVLRVTDEADGYEGGTSYSYWPTFNRDSTRLIARVPGTVCGALLYTFDAENFRATSKEPLPLNGGGCPFIEDAVWSGTDADVLYLHQGAALYAYDARARRYSLVFDLSARLTAGHYFFQASMSLDGDVFAATLKNSSYQVAGYVAYRRSTDQILFQSPDMHNEVHVDKTGRYLFVHTDQQGVGQMEARVVDLHTGAVTDVRDDGPDHAPGHYGLGRGTVVGAGNYLVGVSGRSLGSPRQYTRLLDLSAEQEYGAYHVSMLADDESWALASFYGLMANGVMQGELVQVATDGTGRVRRLLHHHSVFRDYFDTPRANVSRDGRFVAFTSNWGKPGGRRDLFVAKIAPPSSAAATPSPTATATPSPTATATPTPTATVTPTPVPVPLVSPQLVAAAEATCAAMAAGASNSAAHFDALLTALDQALAAFAAERARVAGGEQVEMALRSARYFVSASRALALAEPGRYPAGAQSRLQIAASRLAQARTLLSPGAGAQTEGEQSHFSPSAMPPAVIGAASTVSAASLAPVVAPDSLAAIIGDAARSPLANSTAAAAKLARADLPYELAGASVTIAGRAAPLFHASQSRLSFLVPSGLPAGEAEVVVTSQDGYVSSGTVTIAQLAPALFTRGDTGEAVAFNVADTAADSFGLLSPFNLSNDKRTRLSLFATGFSADAALNTYAPNDVRFSSSRTLVNFAESVAVEARTGGGRVVLLPVEYAGASASAAGVDQINFVLTEELRGAGRVEITLVVAGRRSNTASVNIR